MMNKEVFEIKLEDYRFPRYASTVKSYYGTMDDIINLMVHLADNEWTRTRYQETIDDAEYYDLDPEIPHTVAGQVLPILTPVEDVARFETQLTNRSWYYTAYNGVVYPCWAERLNICHHAIGWANPNDVIKGFPGAVTWDGEHHTMNLFVPQAHYGFDAQDQAIADVVDVNAIDLSAIMADILAEG